MKYELKSIGVWSFLRVAFFFNLITGFLFGLMFAIVIVPMMTIMIRLSTWQTGPFDPEAVPPMALLVFLPIMSSLGAAVFGTMFGIVMVWVYNLIARFIGGLEFKLGPVAEEAPAPQPIPRPQAGGWSQDPPPPPPPVAPPPTSPESSSQTGLDKAPPPGPSSTTDPPPEGPTAAGGPDDSNDEVLAKVTDSPVRVRIAPSPSGYLHVGTARMAICNWLFARHHGGKFLVRVEDTDRERSKPELIERILEAFRWLGLDWDDDIVRQSERIDHYGQYAKQILESGEGYRCFCTPEQLAADREEAKANKGPLRYNRRCLGLTADEIEAKLADGTPYTIRIRIPEGETKYDDMVSGELVRQNTEIEDFIVARSDGSAVYNLAVVVDDHDMGMTHVLRGNDHITNTFKQLHIYRALGWEPPRFGHVPLILRPDKKKMSKRLGDKDVVAFRDEGILPEAMFNYLSLLGWSSKDDREIYTREELVEIFTADNLNASNAVFDEEKLLAFNGEHIAMKPDHELAMLVAPMLVEAGLTTKYWLETRWEYLRSVVGMLKSRARKLSDIVERGGYFFQFSGRYDEEAATKHFVPEAADRLEELAKRFEALGDFRAEAIQACLGEYADQLEIKKGQLIHPTRLAISGMPVGPSLYEMLELLSQASVVERMRQAARFIRERLR